MTIDTSELTINPDLFTKVQKNALRFFLRGRYGLSWSTTHPTCFLSRNITKNAETHPPPMWNEIIEQPLNSSNHLRDRPDLRVP